MSIAKLGKCVYTCICVCACACMFVHECKQWANIYDYEKTRHMGFFVKIEFDVSDELYPRANPPETDCALCFGDSEVSVQSCYMHRKQITV